jgi:hypothetical protein
VGSVATGTPSGEPSTDASSPPCPKEGAVISAGAGQHGIGAFGMDDPPVQGGALGQRPPEWGNERPEAGGVHHLTVAGAGGSRDVFVDQGAAEVVDARDPAAPIFTQLNWMLSMAPR